MSDRLLTGATVLIGLACAGVVGYALLAPPGAVNTPPKPTAEAEADQPGQAEAAPARPAFQPERLLEFPYEPVVDVKASRPEALTEPPTEGESVIGLEVGDEARAYPLAMMARPEAELLNDTLGGVPVAVTWCLRCRNAMAFRRVVRDRTLTLFIPGMTWRRNMVMQDRETQSLWSQILGTAEAGPLAGEALEPIAAVVTDWASWKASHPATTVANLRRLSGPEPVDQRDRYTGAKAEHYVLAIEHDGEAVVWPLPVLAKQPALNDRAGTTPVVATLDPATGTASLFGRTVDGRTLTFRVAGDGPLRDEPTGTTWDRLTGKALDGPLAGRRLTRLPAFVVRREAWDEFHPRTRVGTAASPAPGS